MKRWLAVSFALLCVGIFCLALNAQAQMLPLTGAGGKFRITSIGYTGPGDIVSGALAWWGLRCYNTAYTGSVADVYAPADASHTLLTCSAGGTINETIQALAITCAVSCTVKTLYDQSGALQCGGAACDVTQATEGTRPVFTLAGLGSLSIIASSSKFLGSGAFTPVPLAQPNWISAVVHTTSAAAQGYFGDGPSGNNSIGFSGANTAQLYAGATLTATASTNAWHAIQSVMNGASSDIYVDGVAGAGSAGAQSVISPLFIGKDTYGNFFVGFYTEIGLWNIAPSSGQKSSMNSNQRAYWGF